MTDKHIGRFIEEQIIGFIKQAEAGMPIKGLCRKGGFRDATFSKWRAKFGGVDVPHARINRSRMALTALLDQHSTSADLLIG